MDVFNINGYTLDDNQKKAITTEKENVLLIAGAGSGKTSTIVGKIRYLVEYKNIDCNQILCISFTNKCVDNLKNMLLNDYGYNIDVYTFHKLSLDIIKSYSKDISVSDEKLLDYVINEFFYRFVHDKRLLKKDEYKMLINTIKTFINIFKTKNYNIDKFNTILKKIKYSNKYILI